MNLYVICVAETSDNFLFLDPSELCGRLRAVLRLGPVRRPGQSLRKFGRGIAVSPFDLLLRQPFSPAEDGTFEMRRANAVGALEEVCLHEVGTFEMSPGSRMPIVVAGTVTAAPYDVSRSRIR